MKQLTLFAVVSTVKCQLPLWGSWGAWTACSVSCGTDGLRSRTRPCLEDGDPIEPLVCGPKGKDVHTVICNYHRCAIDGGWSAWGQWYVNYDDYAVKCTRTRFRLCDNPRPAFGGLLCPDGDDRETADCDVPAIPANHLENGPITFTHETLYSSTFPARYIQSDDCDVQYYLFTDGQKGHGFTIDLGDVYEVNEILIRNTKNEGHSNGDRGTREFRIDVKMTDDDQAPSRSIVQGTLTDARSMHCSAIPLESFPLAQPTPFRFLRFYILSFYQLGGGIQYMELR